MQHEFSLSYAQKMDEKDPFQSFRSKFHCSISAFCVDSVSSARPFGCFFQKKKTQKQKRATVISLCPLVWFFEKTKKLKKKLKKKITKIKTNVFHIQKRHHRFEAAFGCDPFSYSASFAVFLLQITQRQRRHKTSASKISRCLFGAR